MSQPAHLLRVASHGLCSKVTCHLPDSMALSCLVHDIISWHTPHPYVWLPWHSCCSSRNIPTSGLRPLSLGHSFFVELSCCFNASFSDSLPLLTSLSHLLLCHSYLRSESSAVWLCFYTKQFVSHREFSQLQPLNDNDARAQYIFREYLLNQRMGSKYETGIGVYLFCITRQDFDVQ